jgi:hypothetical protein
MDELTQLKSDVSLVDYALSLGYERDPAKSTKAVTFLRRDDDKIIVRRGNCGYDIYAHVPDYEREQGSIIDFIQSREGVSIGEIRKRLRAFIGKPKPEGHQDHSPSIKSNDQAESPAPVIQDNALSKSDRERIQWGWDKSAWSAEPAYLISRGIPASVRNDPRFAGCWRISSKGAVLFPHRDMSGLCGLEIRGDGVKVFSKGGHKGLWLSANIKTCLRIVITESPIDALSFHALHVDSTDAIWPLGYASFGGGLGHRQKSLLGALVSRAHDRGAEVIIATDSDQAGDEYATTLQSLSPVALERILPIGKDWSDDLCWCVRECGGEL